ncbi:MAG: YwaF family protein [Eubacteriaceae bacterium]|nr:YwaF family protein [Eubacteriaceae bacterium]
MPRIFGVEHLIYLAFSLSLTAAGLIFIRKMQREGRDTLPIIRITGGVLFICISLNRIAICALRDGWSNLLPGSFCGASSLALSLLAVFGKRDNPALHCVAYTGLLGGLLTIAYPDFISQAPSIFYPMTITGLMHHSVMIYLVLAMLQTGFLKPSLKKWKYLPLGLCCYMTFGLFCVDVLGYIDAMYIEEAILPGTPLKWFVLGPVFLLLHYLFLLFWDKIILGKGGKARFGE